MKAECMALCWNLSLMEQDLLTIDYEKCGYKLPPLVASDYIADAFNRATRIYKVRRTPSFRRRPNPAYSLILFTTTAEILFMSAKCGSNPPSSVRNWDNYDSTEWLDA